ncbi:MAG: hypothetical protein AAGG72_06160, partial [Pseudomonadota bacterium]
MTRFSCAYAHPEQQRAAWITVLFRQSSLAIQRDGRDLVSYTIGVEEPSFLKFADRYMKPVALSATDFLKTNKTL